MESVQAAGCVEAPRAQGRHLPCHHGHKGSLAAVLVSPFGASPGLKSNQSFQVCEKVLREKDISNGFRLRHPPPPLPPPFFVCVTLVTLLQLSVRITPSPRGLRIQGDEAREAA